VVGTGWEYDYGNGGQEEMKKTAMFETNASNGKWSFVYESNVNVEIFENKGHK
jgi:hypothetical protein